MPLYNIRNVGVQSTTRRTMDALLNWRTDSTKEQLKKRNGAVRLILNNGKLRGTHAKLMIGSRSCLLKEDIKSAWMETLLKMQWIFQRYIQEKSCLVVGLQHLETQVNQGMEATTNEEQRIGSFLNIVSRQNTQRKLLLWKLKLETPRSETDRRSMRK